MNPEEFSRRLNTYCRDADVFNPTGTPHTGTAHNDTAHTGTARNGTAYEAVRGHSLRRGFVTAATLAGISPVVIAQHTRHRDLSMLSAYADRVEVESGAWQAGLHLPNNVGHLQQHKQERVFVDDQRTAT